jgi:hypothetical protein
MSELEKSVRDDSAPWLAPNSGVDSFGNRLIYAALTARPMGPSDNEPSSGGTCNIVTIASGSYAD